MRLRAGREDANKNSERNDRLRKFGATLKSTAGKAARSAIFAGTLLVSGLMLSGKANAEEKSVKQPEKALSVKMSGGAYNQGKDPFIGAGVSGHLGYEHVVFDATVDFIAKDFKKVEIDNAELDITFPIHDYFALTPFVYRSQYYGGVNTGAGVILHVPKLNLHAAPHWCDGNLIEVGDDRFPILQAHPLHKNPEPGRAVEQLAPSQHLPAVHHSSAWNAQGRIACRCLRS